MSKSNSVDLNDLLVFASVVEAGSFTAAGDRAGSSKAQVSLQIRRLERALGYELFHRTTRRITLTDLGAVLLADCVPYVRKATDLLLQTALSGKELTGTLRISATIEHAAHTLGRHVAEFAKQHPKVAITLRTSDRVEDLVQEGVDVAFRIGWLPSSSLRATRLCGFKQVVVAAPEYLRRTGEPQHPDELAAHDWVAMTLLPAPLTWTFTDDCDTATTVRMRARLRADNQSTLRALLEAGAGVSVVPLESHLQTSLDEGRLVQLLPQWTLPEVGLYAVFPPGRHLSPLGRSFVNFHRAELNTLQANSREERVSAASTVREQRSCDGPPMAA